MQPFTRSPARAIAAAALALAAWSAHAAGYADSTVDPTAYTRYGTHTDPSVTLDVSASAQGHPGASMWLHYTNSGGPINLVSMAGFVYDAFTYTPAVQGAVAGVDFSNDRYVDGGDYLNANLTTFSRALLLQGGQLYVAALFDAGQVRQSWFTTAATGLGSADFALFDAATGNTDGTQHPDFSAAGAPMRFGFMNRLFFDTLGGAYALDATFRFDNIAITVTPVPEPRTAAMWALGLAVMGLLARRRLSAP